MIASKMNASMRNSGKQPQHQVEQQKLMLSREIAKTKADLERQRLEDEIKAMEAAIAKQQALAVESTRESTEPSAQPKKRLVRKVRRVPKKKAYDNPAADNTCSMTECPASTSSKTPSKPPSNASLKPLAESPVGLNEQLLQQIKTRSSTTKKASFSSSSTSPPSLGGPSESVTGMSPEEQLQNEIRQMEAAIALQKMSVSLKSEPVKPSSPRRNGSPTSPVSIQNSLTNSTDLCPPASLPRLNLMSAITAAATSRENRLEETGGELQMKETEPEVEEQKRGAPQLSFALAELVSKKATDRESRLAAGGEHKMTKIKEKEQYKNEFSNICVDAAAMGRLTRLNEHTIEAVACEKTAEEAWKSSGLLAIQWRSNHMSVIHEAARTGAETRMPEKVVSNCPELEEDWDLETEKISARMQQLLELNGRVGEGQHKVDKLVLGRKEENEGGESMIVKPMVCYSNIEDVKLPKKRPPRIDPEKYKERLKKDMEEAVLKHRPLQSISHDVAEKAWERRMRLDRPGGMPKILEKCPCPYCVDPSPYQTYAYRVKHDKRIEEGYESVSSEEERRQKREERRLARRKTRPPPTAEPIDRENPDEQGRSGTTTSPDEVGGGSLPRKRKPRPKKTKSTESQATEGTSFIPPPSSKGPSAENPAIVKDGGCACVIL
jgi:hypothetical protein